MADLKEEFFKAIYLNKANVVLSVDILAKGTVDQATVYPREVAKRGLELGASAIIFVHNHPSGDMKPSRSKDYQKGHFSLFNYWHNSFRPYNYLFKWAY